LDHRPGEETEELQLKMKMLHFREKQQTAADKKCRETPKNEEF